MAEEIDAYSYMLTLTLPASLSSSSAYIEYNTVYIDLSAKPKSTPYTYTTTFTTVVPYTIPATPYYETDTTRAFTLTTVLKTPINPHSASATDSFGPGGFPTSTGSASASTAASVQPAQTSSAPQTAPTIVASPGLSTGAAVGIGVGATIALILLAVVGFILIRRYRRNRKPWLYGEGRHVTEWTAPKKKANMVEPYKQEAGGGFGTEVKQGEAVVARTIPGETRH